MYSHALVYALSCNNMYPLVLVCTCMFIEYAVTCARISILVCNNLYFLIFISTHSTLTIPYLMYCVCTRVSSDEIMCTHMDSFILASTRLYSLVLACTFMYWSYTAIPPAPLISRQMKTWLYTG